MITRSWIQGNGLPYSHFKTKFSYYNHLDLPSWNYNPIIRSWNYNPIIRLTDYIKTDTLYSSLLIGKDVKHLFVFGIYFFFFYTVLHQLRNCICPPTHYSCISVFLNYNILCLFRKVLVLICPGLTIRCTNNANCTFFIYLFFTFQYFFKKSINSHFFNY